MTTSNRISLKGQALRQDNIFLPNELVDTYEYFNCKLVEGNEPIKFRKGYDKCVISNGKAVNFVSNQYGHLPNEKFFTVVEEMLINADVNYDMRSINQDDCNFAVDYILNDDRYNIVVANGKDIIKPMLRFVNSYNGKNKTSGHFGYFRQVCTNGLHIAETKLSFSTKHTGGIIDFVLPQINVLINEFLSNEYYELQLKAESMSNVIISDVADFVKRICEETKLFRFDKSEKNPAPSKTSQSIIDSIMNEANYLNTNPNMWLGYNAFNDVIHSLAMPFEKQKEQDAKVFSLVAAM